MADNLDEGFSLLRRLRVLGLDSGASLQDVERAYHDLVRVWHPDRFQHDERLRARAEEELKKINSAHDALVKHFANKMRGARREAAPPPPPPPPRPRQATPPPPRSAQPQPQKPAQKPAQSVSTPVGRTASTGPAKVLFVTVCCAVALMIVYGVISSSSGPPYSYTGATESLPPSSAQSAPSAALPTGFWAAIVASIPESESAGQAEAEQMRSRLATYGKTAYVARSSEYPSLRPGYIVVFTGQYATGAEAESLVQELKAAGFDAYARQFTK